MLKLNCAIFRPSHAPWRRWSPVGTPRAAPTRRPGSPPPTGRPSIRHNAPHAAFCPAANHRTPCAPSDPFLPYPLRQVPSRAPLPSPRVSLWPARLEEENGSGPSIITNDLVEEKKQTHWPPPTSRSRAISGLGQRPRLEERPTRGREENGNTP